MSEAIKFQAKASKVTGGGDDVRVVLELKDSPLDVAAAVSLFGDKLRRVLRISAYAIKDETAFADFRATIPELQTGICFNSRGSTVIKLDVPRTDRLEALKLVGYSDKFIRFEIEDEAAVEKAEKAPKEVKPKEPKGPYSYFWEYLCSKGRHPGRGFVTLPGVEEALEAVRMATDEDVWDDLLHRLFGVETLVLTSDKDVLEKFPPEKYPQVKTAVERAMNFQQEKEGQLCQQSQQ